MTYENINNILFERLPELRMIAKEAIEEELTFWKAKDVCEIPSYCLLETIVGDYMRSLLLENGDVSYIKRLFDFFEEMATCEDIDVRTLLKVGFLEQLFAGDILLPTSHKYMHEQTRILCDQLIPYFRKPSNG